jgi:hypothetical protein
MHMYMHLYMHMYMSMYMLHVGADSCICAPQDGTVPEYTSFHGPLAVSPVCILKSSGPYGSLALPYLDGMMPAMRSGLGARRNATRARTRSTSCCVYPRS